MRALRSAGFVLLAACSGGRVETVSPSAGPAAVAAAFMQAVADSNLAQMGALWGTGRGPSSATNTPSDWVQRVTVIHAYLQGGTFRVVGEASPALSKEGERQVMIELTRSGCVKNVPFTMVRTQDQAWIVGAIDLNAAGVPGRPCGSSSTPGTPPNGAAFIR